MHDYLELKQAITTEAHRLGFTHCGITAALPVPHLNAFQNWVSAGNHASMAYLARPDTLAKRADPALILPGCQRVIGLAIPYASPQVDKSEIRPGYGRISAYARTRDYHDIILEKLAQLQTFIHTLTDNQALVKSFSDSSPILERSFAAQAGIGFPGKNSCLIIPGEGSYCFLAGLLTNLPLPTDTPFTRDMCGSCQRCLIACPTGCILPNRTIDARRCISFLTIENKDIISDVLKPLIGDWFFGCDICQSVCPHNSRPTTYQTNPLGEPVLPEQVDLVSLLSMDQAALLSTISGTALTRAKRRGLLRNAAIVLGNQRCQEALPMLQALLNQESDPIIQDACTWAIAQISIIGTEEAQG